MSTNRRRTSHRLGIALLLLVAHPAAAEDLEQSVPARPGGTLHIDLDRGSVLIEHHEEHSVRLSGRASRAGRDPIRLESDGQDVHVRGSFAGWHGFLGDPRVRVRVRVPQRYSLEIETKGGSIEVEEIHGDVNARTSGGSIEVHDVIGDVELETSGGGVRAHGVRGNLRIRTSGSPIHASKIEGEVEVQTSGGRIQLNDVLGPVEAETSGGPIAVRFTDAPEGDIRTSGGSIQVEFGAEFGVDLDARTSGGRIEVESEILVRGSLSRSEIQGQINGGGANLQIETSGGNIRIRLR